MIRGGVKRLGRSRQRRPVPSFPEDRPLWSRREAARRLASARAKGFWPTGASLRSLRTAWRLTARDMALVVNVTIDDYTAAEAMLTTRLPETLALRTRGLIVAACQLALMLTSPKRAHAVGSAARTSGGKSVEEAQATPSSVPTGGGVRTSGGDP